MYQFERNTRVHMKSDGKPDERPASRSPLQETTNKSHHRSSQAIHTNGKDCNGASAPHRSTTKSLKDTQHRAISSELGDLTAPGETKTKTQMAREFREAQELYKSADSKAGLQTVKTRRVLKKTTTITKGENEKTVSSSSGCWACRLCGLRLNLISGGSILSSPLLNLCPTFLRLYSTQLRLAGARPMMTNRPNSRTSAARR